MGDIEMRIIKEKVILMLIILMLLGIDGEINLPFFLLMFLLQLASHMSSWRTAAPLRKDSCRRP